MRPSLGCLLYFVTKLCSTIMQANDKLHPINRKFSLPALSLLRSQPDERSEGGSGFVGEAFGRLSVCFMGVIMSAICAHVTRGLKSSYTYKKLPNKHAFHPWTDSK
jgi:hypothetical protein